MIDRISTGDPALVDLSLGIRPACPDHGYRQSLASLSYPRNSVGCARSRGIAQHGISFQRMLLRRFEAKYTSIEKTKIDNELGPQSLEYHVVYSS